MASQVFLPNAEFSKHAKISSLEQYRQMYKKSVEDPDRFWGEIAKELYWNVPPGKKELCRYNFDTRHGKVFVKWFDAARTNIAYNALDRNVEKGFGNRTAYFWEGNEMNDTKRITYKELLEEVCKFANVLKNKGLKKGDRVAIYMPMILELVIAMLACVRIGLVHSIVFGGYSAESLAERMMDAKASLLITADGGFRGPKLVNLKEIAEKAVEICVNKGHKLKAVIAVKHLGSTKEGKEMHPHTQGNWNIDCTVTFWHNEMAGVSNKCEPEWMEAEDPLFILYTSGSTGKPKGILHTTAGYMIYAYTTFKYVFDYHEKDIYFCTADIGWITGHTYVTYGPLLNAATSVIFEGVPFYPDASRFWKVIDKYRVSIFYTAPTAIRALMRFSDDYVKNSDRGSLRLLGSVGEPINPEAWLWYHRVVGDGRCPIVDTFWQTETGGIVITPLPGCIPLKPGSACFPFFGVVAKLLTEEGKEITGEGEGYLVFERPWPGMMRSVYGSQERYETTYFKKFPGYYCTGDGARRDADGYLWITGRVDDMLNVSGHLLSTAAVESALITHQDVAETAVVSTSHPVKGECLYCFIVLKEGRKFDENMNKELKEKVRYWIGPFATPEYLHITSGLPKTRSGKILRRVLRKIAANDRDLGDLTSLADDSLIEKLFQTRPQTA
ncbi:acetyl-coenzyme A synthetase, cytoplasmic-like [Stegodyphus dumicola]|uniref:acetyl-coenzyme A synthetase, cytoplasmic-like n=1 Tax=Stegodyphus dumicola TaxID=202533 RepID=UPI0015AF1842|nr:acetyl-coenzyme A synthetase, cytoplasmic-like [Stegodyphus dumicola]